MGDLLNLMYHGGLRFYHRLIQTFTTPNNAGPNDPRIVRSSIIPTELLTWAAANSVTLYVVDIWYFTSNTYFWEGIGTFFGLTAKFEGTYDPTNGVYVTRRTLIDLSGGGGLGSIIERVGSSALDSFNMLYSFQTALLSSNEGVIPFILPFPTQRNSNVGTFTAETVVDTINVNLLNGYSYVVIADIQVQSSVADGIARVRIREDNVAGNQIGLRQVSTAPAANQSFPIHIEAPYASPSNQNKTFVTTVVRQTGTGNLTATADANNTSVLYVNYF